MILDAAVVVSADAASDARSHGRARFDSSLSLPKRVSMEGCENRTWPAAGPYNPELTDGALFTDGIFDPPAAVAYYYCRSPVIIPASKKHFPHCRETGIFLFVLYSNLLFERPWACSVKCTRSAFPWQAVRKENAAFFCFDSACLSPIMRAFDFRCNLARGTHPRAAQ